MTRTVVVGGGPAGLAAAYRLVQHPDQTVLLIECAPSLGGLAAGFHHDGCALDFGPHRLHPATDPRVLAELRSLLGAELEVRRRSGRIRLAGRYLPYPIGPISALRLGPEQLARLGVGAVAARLTRSRDAPGSYEAALEARVGGPLYRLFYEPYGEKVWGLPGSRIAADQADRRVNQRGLADLLRLALGRGAGHHYLYPRGGFGRIPAAYSDALSASASARLVYPAAVEAVEGHSDRIRALRYARDGQVVAVDADHLVWTGSLPELISRLEPPPPPAVRQAVARLRHRAVVLCYVALAVPRVGGADTYYFPERRFPFSRVMEQKSFSEAAIPPDRTVLCLDLACDPEDATFASSDEQLGRLVLPALEEAGLARSGQVVEVFSRRFRRAYPIYDLGYRGALRETLDWLGGFQNLWLVGRQGLFLHNNTHHSLLMGHRAADAIAAGGDRGCWTATLAEFAAFRVAD